MSTIDITVNGAVIAIPARTVTGEEIRRLAYVDVAHDLYLTDPDGGEDVFVPPGMLIGRLMARRFFTVPQVIGAPA